MRHMFSVIYMWKLCFVKYVDSSTLFPLSIFLQKKHYTYTRTYRVAKKFVLALPDISMYQINRVGIS